MACRRLLALLLCCGAICLESCRRADASGVQVVCEIEPRPARVGEAAVTVRVSDERSMPVKGAHVETEGNMTHPGMAPTFGRTREVADGVYLGRLDLSMPGDWVVQVHVSLPGGTKVERQMNVSGVLPK